MGINVNKGTLRVGPYFPLGRPYIPLEVPQVWASYLLSWHRSDTVVLNGSSVVSVTDKSGNGRHLGQSTLALAPTQETAVALFNGQNSFNFNGSTQYLSGTIWNLSNQSNIGYTIFAVFIPQAWGNDGIWDLSDNTLTNRYAQLMHEGTTRVRYGAFVPVMPFANPTVNQPTYITANIESGSLNDGEVWVKGVSVATTTTDLTATKPINLRIGMLFQDVYPFQAKYAELIICSGTLPIEGRQAIEAYIAARYAIT